MPPLVIAAGLTAIGTTAASVASTRSASGANRRAADASARANAEALAFAQEQDRLDRARQARIDAEEQARWDAEQTQLRQDWDAREAREAPYRQASNAALMRLGEIAGIDVSGLSAPTTRQAPAIFTAATETAPTATRTPTQAALMPLTGMLPTRVSAANQTIAAPGTVPLRRLAFGQRGVR